MTRCPVPHQFRDGLIGALSSVMDDDISAETQIAMLTDAAEAHLASLPYDADAHDCAIWFLEHHA